MAEPVCRAGPTDLGAAQAFARALPPATSAIGRPRAQSARPRKKIGAPEGGPLGDSRLWRVRAFDIAAGRPGWGAGMKAAPGRRSVMATVEAAQRPQTTCQIVARRLVASHGDKSRVARG